MGKRVSTRSGTIAPEVLSRSWKKFLLRKNFACNCKLWRNREAKEGLLADVYDGNLWKEFQTINGTPFLKKSQNYAFMLNFDFFQPIKHRKDYSVEVFYLAVLNLPRAERFEWENIIHTYIHNSSWHCSLT